MHVTPIAQITCDADIESTVMAARHYVNKVAALAERRKDFPRKIRWRIMPNVACGASS